MSDASDLLWYIALLGITGVSALLIALVVSRFVRRRLHQRASTQAFSLEDLRRMRDGGRITQPEYEAMRAAVIAEMGIGAPRLPAETADRRLDRDPSADEDAGDGAADATPDD
jgi:hypothetical protein